MGAQAYRCDTRVSYQDSPARHTFLLSPSLTMSDPSGGTSVDSSGPKDPELVELERIRTMAKDLEASFEKKISEHVSPALIAAHSSEMKWRSWSNDSTRCNGSSSK